MKKWIQTPSGKQQVDSTTNPNVFSPQELEQSVFMSNIVNNYNQAITDLETIQNTTNPTNAQVVAAVKREAEILEYILKAIRNIMLSGQ